MRVRRMMSDASFIVATAMFTSLMYKIHLLGEDSDDYNRNIAALLYANFLHSGHGFTVPAATEAAEKAYRIGPLKPE